MSMSSEQISELMQRLDDLEREIGLVRDKVDEGIRGDLTNITDNLDGRVAALEAASATLAVQLPQIVAGDTREAEDEGDVVTDIEYGLVKEEPSATPSATITLRPCDKDGTEYEAADDVTVYVCADRAEVNQAALGWTTSTILSWLRFASNIGSAPAVSGVVLNTTTVSTPEGQTTTRTYTFRAHTGGFEATDTDAFYSVPDVLCSFARIYVEIRDCYLDGADAGAEHPKFRTPVFIPSTHPNNLSIGPDGDDAWMPLYATHINTGGGIDTSLNYNFEVRVTVDGALELRFNGDLNPGIGNAKIYGFVEIIPFGTSDDALEIGTSQTSDEVTEDNPNGVYFNDHEVGTPADPTPITYVWGDNKWRST